MIVEPGRAPRSAPRLPPPPPLVPQVLEEAAAALDRLLDDAVRARLPTTGTVVAFLSGGVDSAGAGFPGQSNQAPWRSSAFSGTSLAPKTRTSSVLSAAAA